MPDSDEIDDPAVRDAIDSFQLHMEAIILALLDEDRQKALTYLDGTRENIIDCIKNGFLGSAGYEFIPIDREAKGCRIELALIEGTFRRLRYAVEYSDDDDGAGGQAQ